MWLVAILIAAIGTALTNWLVPRFTDVISSFTTTGDPVAVHVSEFLSPYPIALPANVQMTDSLLGELNQLTTQDQRSRLEDLGGIPQGTGIITVTVTGNRADEVRITNITPIVQCSAPDPGTLIYTEQAVGGAADSTPMHLTIDESPPVPRFFNEDMEMVPFFPARTISLKHDEQVVIAIYADTTESTCSFELDMSVLVGDETQNQRIKNGDKPFVRTPFLENKQYEQVYYGGNVCREYTKEEDLPSGSSQC